MLLQEVVHNAIHHGKADGDVTIRHRLDAPPSGSSGSGGSGRGAAERQSGGGGGGGGGGGVGGEGRSAQLHISIRNAPGAKHAQLLAHFPPGTDLLDPGTAP